MKTRNSPAKDTTPKQDKTVKSEKKPLLTDRTSENAVLEIWANANVFPLPTPKKKRANTGKSSAAQAKPRRRTRRPSHLKTYVLREIPTDFYALTLETLSRKICQDVFLKASIMQGHRVTYVPVWEAYPLWIEESVIAKAKSKVPSKLPLLRKRCRARQKQELEIQRQKFYQLGIFGDWAAAQKALESRQEAKHIALISRLRDSGYLHDLPQQLSPWCPKCTAPLNEANLVQKPANVLNGYVKFPFNFGLEEFGINVSFCIRMHHLWEIAGTIGIGIAEEATCWLTKSGEEYLLFAEPQLDHLSKHFADGQPEVERIKKIEATELSKYTVAHPLFPSKTLEITRVPKTLIAKTPEPSTDFLEAGVLPLNPAHHQPSYDIANALTIKAAPIFDETGRFTEEAGQLCGLPLFGAEKFIVPQLEKHGYLLKTHNDEINEPHCSRCKESAVFRPSSKWLFSIAKNRDIIELLKAQEYWDNYTDTEHKHIQTVRDSVLRFEELQVSTQRQWGMPLPILLCDHCDEPLTDKNALNAIRSSIQRSFEFWFGLSIEELLPADTRCLKCHSSDFRKEATLIDSHFANLLQIIDNSDFKKAPGGHTSVMFVPETSLDEPQWTKWLAEISVISAALSRSRPIKESQPFKQLKFKTLPSIRGDIQIADGFLNKYPADIVRLVAIAPNIGTKRVSRKHLEKLADNYFEQYQHLQAFFDDISNYLYLFLRDFQKASGAEPRDATSDVGPDNPQATTANQQEVQTKFAAVPTYPNLEASEAATGKMLQIDSLIISTTTQLLMEVEQAYQTQNLHQMWVMLTNFCEDDLLFYRRTMESRPAKTLFAAQTTLSWVATVLLQRFAPLTPFFAEHFYQHVSIESVTGNRSIFQGKWQARSPLITQDINPNQAKVEWENVKRAHDAKS